MIYLGITHLPNTNIYAKSGVLKESLDNFIHYVVKKCEYGKRKVFKHTNF